MQSLECGDGVDGDDDVVKAARNVGAFSTDEAKTQLPGEEGW